MKKIKLGVMVVGVLLAVVFLIYACGKAQDASTGGAAQNPVVTTADLFDVSGAKAIATASEATTSSSAIKSMSAANITELLKIDAEGAISSVLTNILETQYHPPISVIETGPDDSLYVGFQWGIWVSTSTSTDAATGQQAAFFKIDTDGDVAIVDEDLYGVGTWYGYSENGELPVKQVQFDSDDNLYYLGVSATGSTVLKKKTTDGTISQIGTSNMEVRDFLVADNGFVFFHGSNAGSWDVEWLRVIYNNSVNNIFYNDGQGWLRSYYNFVSGSNNYVFLVGEDLTLLDENAIPKKYSGIIRVTLDATGKPSNVEALYDDKDMYNDTHTTIGDQLTWGYWDPTEMQNKKFFVTDDYNEVILPLSLVTGVTEASIDAFIRKKYQSVTEDNLDKLDFTDITTAESWQLSNYLNDLVADKITGKTWAKWREENDLSGVRFANAKQLLFSGSNKLYAVMRLDDWGGGSSKGDKLFQISDVNGDREIIGFPQDAVNYYKSMTRARLYGTYCIYLSNKVGQYKILRLNLADNTAAPVDMTPNLSNVEIFSFSYNPDNSKIMYDYYDLSDNKSYYVEQEITSATGATESAADGYTITDVVPFSATN
ncbi:hypothetical protein ACFL5U_01995 [Candidatus Margulisiibacteriota bacterium]